MKISKIFHWLYLSLLVLPIVAIPVFMIYSHRHNIEGNSVTTGGFEIQERYQTNDVNTIDDIVAGNVYHLDTLLIDSGWFGETNGFIAFEILSYSSIDYDLDGYAVDEIYLDQYNSNLYNFIDVVLGHNYVYVAFTNADTYVSLIDITYIKFYSVDLVFVDTTYLSLVSQNFNGITSSDYQSYSFEYNEGLVYNDTDIMSQFTYSLYNTTEKYYNFDNFFALGEIRQWFNTNFFNGNPSLGFGIAWHLLTYWFVVSIFWLIFDVLMYLPLLVHRWLDKGAIA